MEIGQASAEKLPLRLDKFTYVLNANLISGVFFTPFFPVLEGMKHVLMFLWSMVWSAERWPAVTQGPVIGRVFEDGHMCKCNDFFLQEEQGEEKRERETKNRSGGAFF